MTDRDEENALLEEWAARVVEALDIEGLELDINAVLGLAGRAAHAVVRPAAPLTTFLVGYAAGQAAAGGAGGSVVSADAVRAATDTALRLCAERANNAG
ncbi:DUF6457 domain-containing protein [Leifsonia sp. Root112D2]|uniref:DUF6457 domain-containing protein n=1 Tax=Leifsonia sp. Root112D2 TaxID=1736426 RepID=UPI0006F9D2D5|nr:DUF6457 domain-containing protein [Leifsonia sp. Root112D2]KQV06153.1 hypothetical protein ASC63_01310 [Leifsonia sp. Root112D2]